MVKTFSYLSGNEYIKVWIINQKYSYNPKFKKKTPNKRENNYWTIHTWIFSSFQNMSYTWAKGVCNVSHAAYFPEFCFAGLTIFFPNICEISIDFSTFEVRFIINWRQIKTKLTFAWFIKSFISYKTCILPFFLFYMIHWKEQYFETVHKYDTYLKKMCRFSLKSKTKSYVKRTCHM